LNFHCIRPGNKRLNKCALCEIAQYGINGKNGELMFRKLKILWDFGTPLIVFATRIKKSNQVRKKIHLV
ncbi:MAG: hypothetical protein ABI772_15545, partial [Bacteroidota bacterium]